jgi:hypothetical protein
VKIYHRGKKYILDFRFKIVELNKSYLKKFPNLQSTINNLKLHLSVSLWLANKSAYRNLVSRLCGVMCIGAFRDCASPKKYQSAAVKSTWVLNHYTYKHGL